MNTRRAALIVVVCMLGAACKAGTVASPSPSGPVAAQSATSWRQQLPGCDLITPVGMTRDGRAYYAVVVGAYNAAGGSVQAIAETARWWNPGPGDQPC